MDEIISFLKQLFELEKKALNAGNFKDRHEEYNKYANQIKQLMNEITVGLGVPVLDKEKPDFFYDEEEVSKVRHIYKITHYENDKYGELWSCYVSKSAPYKEIKTIGNCYVVANIDGELKMVSEYIEYEDTKRWRRVGGDEDLSDLYNLGKIISIERLLAPEDDEWSMEQYEAEI